MGMSQYTSQACNVTHRLYSLHKTTLNKYKTHFIWVALKCFNYKDAYGFEYI